MALQLKNDCSYLFSSLQSSGSSASSLNALLGSTTLLSDYASIKNGSYGKLMKAYYADPTGESSVSSIVKQSVSTSEDSSQTLKDIQSSTDALKDASDALLSKDSDSVFASDDMDKIYDAVSTFVKEYNTTIGSLEDVNNSTLQKRAESLMNLPTTNSNLLKKVGITIQGDNTLALDEETFKAASTSTIKNLFHGSGSFAYQVSAQSSLTNYTATQQASKANTYTNNATFGSTYSSGDLFSAYL